MLKRSPIPTLLAAAAMISAGCASPLMRAAKTGDTAEVRALLNRGADPNADKNVPMFGLMSPLLMAAYYNHPEAAQALLEGGADINQRCPRLPMTRGCESAVGCAVAGGHSLMLDFLISRGGVVTQRDIDTAQGAGHAAMGQVLARAFASQKAQVRQRLASTPDAASVRRDLRSIVDFPQHQLKARPQDYALIVAIEKYSKVPEALYAERDGQAMRRHLMALGYAEKNIVLLAGAQATSSGLQSYLDEWLPRNVKPDSSVVFYYSGHGAPDPATGQAYLVPWDGDPMFLQSSAYSLKRLYASLQKLPAQEVTVVLDACFSGSGGRSVLPKGARPLVSHATEGVAPGTNLVVFAASSGEQITGSLDEEGHGIFTYYFLKGLGGEAKDGQGRISARGLYDYLKPRVEEEARRQNRLQTPALLGATEHRTLASF